MPSWSYRNLFEWIAGSGESADLEATGSLTLTGTADLQVGASMAAAGTFTLSGSAALTLEAIMAAMGSFVLSSQAALQIGVLLAAAGDLVLNGEASLRTARNAGRLENCGDPISTACADSWMPGA